MVLVVRWANDEGFVGVVHGVWTLRAYYVWAMALPLLIIAIMGKVWKSWVIALEENGQLCIVIVGATFTQIVMF
ncbi:hypothetical protein N7467_004169 [Penicillium canescens]|nr:hypothetical protein N7467_004169 [Penicillium canescens]